MPDAKFKPAPYLTEHPLVPTRAITNDLLAELRWMASAPAAVAIVPKQALRLLLDCYERHGLRVIGSLEGVAR